MSIRVPYIVHECLENARKRLDSQIDDANEAKAIEAVSQLHLQLTNNHHFPPLFLIPVPQTLHAIMVDGCEVASFDNPELTPENELKLWQESGNMKQKFLDAEWLFAECYVYRKLIDCFSLTPSTDYFRESKQKALTSFITRIKDIKCHFGVEDESFECFDYYVQQCLWGNQHDLSLHAMKTFADSANSTSGRNLLCNQSRLFFNHLRSIPRHHTQRILHFVLDNAGIELFHDFGLAAFLTRTFSLSIVFHVKRFPWFVSDALVGDVEILLQSLKANDFPDAGVWSTYLAVGKWQIESNLVWTNFIDHHLLQLHTPLLAARLFGSKDQSYSIGGAATCCGTIWKGDLNYRKLIGDLVVDDIATSVDSLFPTASIPNMAIRTCKSDAIAGIHRNIEDLNSEDAEWRLNGKFGVIQVWGGGGEFSL